MPTPPDRIATIDAVRGFAVLGILVMNIVAMGMPVYAYVDPHHYGGATGADLIAWAAAYVLADGKMRALFTMLFGASMGIAADRSDGAAGGHFRRMAWLFVFGMIHAWLFWFGDILVLYAITGAIVFIGWRWQPAPLIFIAAACFLLIIADDLLAWQQLTALRAAATAPGASEAAVTTWNTVIASVSPPPAALAQQIALYRGGFLDALAARTPTILMFQTTLLPLSLAETLGYAAFGLALHRTGFFTGGWRTTTYRALLVAGGVAILFYMPIVRLLITVRFDPATIPLADMFSFLLRPWLALAYASGIVLLVRRGSSPRLVARLVAAGRMALSNYLGTTLIATTLFYGYGFGLYGSLGRANLYGIVIAIWIMILLWSKPWLDRFAYGPLEWLWRGLSQGKFPPSLRK